MSGPAASLEAAKRSYAHICSTLGKVPVWTSEELASPRVQAVLVRVLRDMQVLRASCVTFPPTSVPS